MEDPLKQLLVDTKTLDKEKLANLILGNLGISEGGEIVILPGFSELTTKSKILSFMLAKKAAKIMSLTTNDSTTIKEVSQRTGLPEGTLGRELSELKQLRFVLNEGGYFIPDYAVHLISIEKKSNTTVKQNSKRISRKTSRTVTSGNQVDRSEKLNKLLQINQESIKPEFIDLMLRPGLYLERSLAVLKIARDNGIDDLTPVEIETFLKDKVRSGATWKSNISLYLGKGTRYADRFRDSSGSGFTYRIMVPGEQYLEEALKKLSNKLNSNDKSASSNEEKTE